MGLHPNGVRRHLERLESEHLVERRRVNRGRGRPRDEWVTTPEGADAGTSQQHELATWLAKAMSEGSEPQDFIASGRGIGRELISRPSGDPVADLRDLFTSLGFAPELSHAEDGTLRCKMCRCSYRDAARANPGIVCGLHRGIAEGALGVVSPSASLRCWEEHHPDEAGCTAVIEGIIGP